MTSKSSLSFFIIFLFCSSPLHALNWPILTPPNQLFLSQQNLIETSGCPLGKGKIKNGISINIHQFLCKSFCPIDWTWIASSDESCHDLNSGFSFQNNRISYFKDAHGTTDYSMVIASFGELNSNQPSFQFIFTTKANQHWSCYEMNPEMHLITCANDM